MPVQLRSHAWTTLRAIGRGEADVAAARAVEARAVPRAVARAAAAHSGAVVAEEARLALAAPREERAARCRAARGRPFRAPARCRSRTQPVPRAVAGAHREDERAVPAAEARVARALPEGTGAVPRAVGRAPRKGRGDATVVSREAGLAEARAVTQALAVRRAVARAAADDRRAVGAREAEVACALRVRATPWPVQFDGSLAPLSSSPRRRSRARRRSGPTASRSVPSSSRSRAAPRTGTSRRRTRVRSGTPRTRTRRGPSSRRARRDLDRAVVARVGRRAVAGAVDARRAPRAVARAVLVDRKLHNPLAAVVVELEPCALEPQRAGRDVPDTVILLVRVALVDPHDCADAEPTGLKHAQRRLSRRVRRPHLALPRRGRSGSSACSCCAGRV